LELRPFKDDGLLPPGDYVMSLEELKGSMLVEGPEEGYPNWDSLPFPFGVSALAPRVQAQGNSQDRSRRRR
jgi:hypothetical protein